MVVPCRKAMHFPEASFIAWDPGNILKSLPGVLKERWERADCIVWDTELLSHQQAGAA